MLNIVADHKKRGCSRSRLREDRGQLFHRGITIHTSQLSHHSPRRVTINASHSGPPITASNIAPQTSQQLPRLTSEMAGASKQQSHGDQTLSTRSHNANEGFTLDSSQANLGSTFEGGVFDISTLY